MSLMNDELKQALTKNELLSQENDLLKTQLKEQSSSNKKVVFTTTLKGIHLWAGSDLKESFDQVYHELPNVSKSSFAQLSASLVKRITRIGLFTLLFAVIPVFLILIQTGILFQQNKKLDIQNDRIQQQVYLEEASRRNNLVFLMDNVLDQVHDELQISASISKPLIARTQALLYGFRPYRFLEDEILTKPLSPEKGQFLLAIINSGMNTKSIQNVFAASFSNVYLKRANLFGAQLANIDMPDADLSYADLWNANLTGANLKNSDFTGSQLNNAMLTNADLKGAQLNGATLIKAVLDGAFLEKTQLANSDMRGVSLINVHVDSEDWLEELKEANVLGADELIATYQVQGPESDEDNKQYFVVSLKQQ